MDEKRTINFSDPAHRAQNSAFFAGLSGWWTVSAKQYKPTRSLNANRYYFGVVVRTFQEFMRQHGSYWTKDEVHDFWLREFAPREMVNPLTGEVMGQVGNRSSKMDTEAFADFVNHAIGWMYDRFQITVDQPTLEVRDRKRINSKPIEQKQLTQAQGH